MTEFSSLCTWYLLRLSYDTTLDVSLRKISVNTIKTIELKIGDVFQNA